MNTLRFVTVLCLTLCVAGVRPVYALKPVPKPDPRLVKTLVGDQFFGTRDPNRASELARASEVPPAPAGGERDDRLPRAATDVSRPYTGGLDGSFLSFAGAQKADPNIYNAYKEYWLAYLDGERRKIDDQRAAIASTNRMGSCVFVVVHIFMLLATGIAIEEIWAANHTRRMARKQEEIDISFEKIALKTSMHGTVLLVISVILYFLFLKFVYTMTPV